MGVSNFPNVPIQAYSPTKTLDGKNVVKKLNFSLLLKNSKFFSIFFCSFLVNNIDGK